MTWYQILGLGISGGMFVGGVFYLIGWAIDWRADRAYEREMDEIRDECGS